MGDSTRGREWKRESVTGEQLLRKREEHERLGCAFAREREREEDQLNESAKAQCESFLHISDERELERETATTLKYSGIKCR